MVIMPMQRKQAERGGAILAFMPIQGRQAEPGDAILAFYRFLHLQSGK
ncbi:hypothetical protein [Paenibacillus andongensis]|nr:hypothetical protein [Paenibacillus andongensis]